MKITKTVAIGSTQNEYILHQTKNEIRNFKAMPFAEISERVPPQGAKQKRNVGLLSPVPPGRISMHFCPLDLNVVSSQLAILRTPVLSRPPAIDLRPEHSKFLAELVLSCVISSFPPG